MEKISVDIKNILKNTTVFSTLSTSNIEKISQKFIIHTAPSNTILVKEGEESQSLIIIAQGDAEVLKTEEITKQSHAIAKLSQGDVIGELGLLSKEPRSASIVSSSQITYISITYTDLEKFMETHLKAKSLLLLHIAKIMEKRLKHLNYTTVRYLQLQIETGRFLVMITFMQITFVFSLSGIAYIAKSVTSTTYLSVPLLFVFFFFSLYYIKRTNMPLSTYGLTSKNGWRYSFESVAISIPICIIIFFVKVFLIKFTNIFPSKEIFNSSLFQSHDSLYQITIICLLYAIGVPLQEFLNRGGLQGALQNFLTGKHKDLIAIMISTLQFSAMHLPISQKLAIGVLPLGIFWGWMFLKQRSLLGVTISHIIIGIFALNILDLKKLFF